MCDLGERLFRDGTFSLIANSRFLCSTISRSFSRTRSLASTTTASLSFFTATTFLTVYLVPTFPPGDTSRTFLKWLVPPGLVTFFTRIFVTWPPATFFVTIRFVPSADTFFTCFLTSFVFAPPSELELEPRRCRTVPRFFVAGRRADESRDELLELELESESDESEPLLLELSELDDERRRETGTLRTGTGRFFTTVNVSLLAFCFNAADDDDDE